MPDSGGVGGSGGPAVRRARVRAAVGLPGCSPASIIALMTSSETPSCLSWMSASTETSNLEGADRILATMTSGPSPAFVIAAMVSFVRTSSLEA